MRLEIGDIIKTSYGTGPYRVKKVARGCTCESAGVLYRAKGFDASLVAFPKPHLHLVCSKAGTKLKSHLNFYCEETLKNIFRPDDFLIILENDQPVQRSFF